jgi:HipA-like protein
VANAPSITLLHLSDLQFGPHHRFERSDAPGGLLHRLRDDLARMRDEEGLRPDLVLLTGDLTEYGLKSQFAEMLSFAHGLVEVTELPPRRIVMVPGNHDVNWKLSQGYFAEREGNEEKPVLPYWPKLGPYAEMFAKFYEGQPGVTFTEAEPWTFYEYPELRVVVAGMNSAIAESHRAEDHYGFLGEPQLDYFAGKMRPYKERGWLRIGAVHHDPMHPENDAARQDTKDLKGRLLPYLNMVAHGHIHEEQLGWLHATVPVLGIGSAGVKVPERPPEVPNEYQWVQVQADQVTYGTRAYVPDQKRWVGCVRPDWEGKAWKLTEKVTFEGVGDTFSGRGGAEKAPGVDLAAMVEAYRRHWANAYRREALFELATMGEDADIPAGLDLLHIFVPQDARRKYPRYDLPHESGDEVAVTSTSWDRLKSGHPALIHYVGHGSITESISPPQPIGDILASSEDDWICILGSPGAGKSALTRWVVLKLCTSGESLSGLPMDLVPVRVELRRFDLQYRQARKVARSYDFFDYLDDLCCERNLSLHGEPLRRLAESGRIFWLFDGLDEVADPHARRDYATMIIGVRECFGGRGIVTSRIVGARPAQPLFAQAGLVTYTLQNLNNIQIDRFLMLWHRLAFPGATEAAERRLNRLRRTLRENRAVRELCGNPLLLTLIALLNRGAELPRQRHRLYERAIELMAEQWEANKDLPHGTMHRFDLATKKRFLRQLAFKMMTELPGGTGNTVRQSDLVTFASDFCAREQALKEEDAKSAAEQLIQQLRERNYVLALAGGMTFGFVHKTFLEYLAAVEIETRFRTHEWDVDELRHLFRERWKDQAWLETLTLLCGMLEERPEQVRGLLQAVLQKTNPLLSEIRECITFSLRCLAEVGRLTEESLNVFCLHLTELIVLTSSRWGAPIRALELCGSTWPGATRFRSLAMGNRDREGGDRDTLRQLAIATCEPSELPRLLRHLLPNVEDPYAILSQAVTVDNIKTWTAAEVDEVRATARGLDNDKRAAVLRALNQAGTKLSEEEHDILQRSNGSVALFSGAAGHTKGLGEWWKLVQLVHLRRFSDDSGSQAYVDELKRFMSSSSEDSVRVSAATYLRDEGQPASEWRPVLEHLSRSGRTGVTRLRAAEALADERRIAQLAKRSKHRRVREQAASDLEQLRIYRTLVAIGRPRRAIVSLDGARVGVLEENPGGSRFTYDRAYLSSPNAIALSITLPLRAEPYEARGLHPFFENLLPEGWLLDRTCEKLGLDRTDAFGLLLATCADCAGAVEIVPEPPPGLPQP